MNFTIYEAEKNLGLEMQMRTSASIKYLTPALPEKELAKANLKTVVVDDTLYPVTDILVSTNWNLNDDVFAAGPTWEARNTPLYKPLDLEHDQSNIIGAIIGTRIVDDEMNVIDESAYNDGEYPENFHILNDSVIYRTWSDEKKLAEIDEIIDEVKAGEWFMSMEAQFWGFDYAVEAPDGTRFTIARNEDTAFLSGYLRAYDGDGVFTDKATGDKYKIGRMMSHINFVGKGLVKNPGNPQSVIFAHASTEENGVSNIKENSQPSIVEENTDMTEIDTLKAEIDQLKAELAKRDLEVTTASVDKVTKELDTVKAELAGASDKVAALEAANVELDKAKADLATELKAAQDELQAAKDEAKKADRKKKMVDAGFSAEEADTKVDAYAAMADESFESVMTDIAAIKKAAPAPTVVEATETLLETAVPTPSEPVITPEATETTKANKYTAKLGSIFASTKNKKGE